MLRIQLANALLNMKEFKVNAYNRVQPIVRETPAAEYVYVLQGIYLVGSIYVFLFVHPTAISTRQAICAFVTPITRCLMEYATLVVKILPMMHHLGLVWLSLKVK